MEAVNGTMVEWTLHSTYEYKYKIATIQLFWNYYDSGTKSSLIRRDLEPSIRIRQD